MTNQAFHFGGIGFGVLPTNTLSRDVTGHFVQFQRQSESLFAGHLAVTLDLLLQCHVRGHRQRIPKVRHDSRSATVCEA